MSLLTEKLSVRALFDLRENLELGDGMFQEITGIDAKDLIAYRRGRLKQKPIVSKEAEERIERCKRAFALALEFCGDNDRALDWLYADASNFGGKSPIDLTLIAGGLEKIQSYIDVMRSAIAGPIASAEKGNSEKPNPLISLVAQQSSPKDGVKNLPLVVVSPPKKAMPTAKVESLPITQTPKLAPMNGATKAAPSITPTRLSIDGVYIPSGMARSRSQTSIPLESPPPTGKSQNRDVLAPNPPKNEPTSSAVELPPATELPQNRAEPAEKKIPEKKQPPAHGSGLTQDRTGFAPPAGVDPQKRLFRLKDPLLRLRAKRPDLTLKDISDLMVKRGLKQFEVQSHASRLFKSYTWGTWTEVVHLAELFDGDPYELGSVRSE